MKELGLSFCEQAALKRFVEIVVTGDETQNDLPASVTSGLNDAMKRLKNVPGTACVNLDGNDIVRHRLVREIVKAYDDRPHSVEK